MAKVQVPESPIIKEVLRYSERIEQLRIKMQPCHSIFQGFKWSCKPSTWVSSCKRAWGVNSPEVKAEALNRRVCSVWRMN